MKDYCLHNFMLQPINTLEKISYTLKHTHTQFWCIKPTAHHHNNSGVLFLLTQSQSFSFTRFGLHNASPSLLPSPPPFSTHRHTLTCKNTQTTENLFASLHISKQDRFVSLSSQTLYCASAVSTHTHTVVSYHLLCAVPSVLLACLGRLDENFQLSLKWQKN